MGDGLPFKETVEPEFVVIVPVFAKDPPACMFKAELDMAIVPVLIIGEGLPPAVKPELISRTRYWLERHQQIRTKDC